MWFLAMCSHIGGKVGNRDTPNQATCPRAGIFQGRTFRVSTSMLCSVDHNIPYVHRRKHLSTALLKYLDEASIHLSYWFLNTSRENTLAC